MNLKDEIKEVWSNYEYTISNNLYSSVFADGFVAGVNSKWAQAEKIKSQIDILWSVCYDYSSSIIIPKIKDLEQQLKEIEDESKID